MKLVIFGLTVSSSWGNGHATLWRGLIRALAKDGHQVVFFEHDVSYYADQRDLNELPGGRLVLYPDWDQVCAQARRELDDADVGMVTSYCPDGVPAAELMFESRARLRTFYDLDTPVTLERLRRGEDVFYLGPRGLRDFDLVFSFTGGTALDEMRTRLGARRAVPLYGSVDPDLHRPVAHAEQYRADLSYLGTYAEDRQEALQRLFIEPARLLPEQRFLIGGALYPQAFPWTTNIFFVRHLPPIEHPAFYSSSRLTLNVTRAPMAEMGYCPSGRLFEAAACSAPLLTDTWPGIETFFEPGTEILIAHSTEDTIRAMEMTEPELAKIARAARERTLEEHTAARRARELARELELALEQSPPILVPESAPEPAAVPCREV